MDKPTKEWIIMVIYVYLCLSIFIIIYLYFSLFMNTVNGLNHIKSVTFWLVTVQLVYLGTALKVSIFQMGSRLEPPRGSQPVLFIQAPMVFWFLKVAKSVSSHVTLDGIPHIRRLTEVIFGTSEKKNPIP
jgi:hypothetical protein